MINKIDLTKYNIKNNDFLVVGVSGGADSIALLDLLLNSANPDRIIVTHINHNVRPESKDEEEDLRLFCLKQKLQFETIKLDNYEEHNFENEARKKRYQFYEKILQKYHSHFLFLAHHGDDLIETVLMKIIRGSNLTGYIGIKEQTFKEDYTIIRPLLKYTKEELITYNQTKNLKYFNDKTNDDLNYTRNRYRHTILPLLKKEDPSVHLKFLRYSNILNEYDQYITKICKEKIAKEYHHKLEIDKFKREDSFIQKNIIYCLLTDLYHNKDNIIKEKNLIDIIKLINNKQPNAKINLPLGYEAVKEYKYVYLSKITKDDQNYKLKLEQVNIIDKHIIEIINKTEENGNNICKLDSTQIKLPLHLRNRKNGDFMEVKNLNGKKKIKDLFIEAKIPIKDRKNYPLLVDDDDNIIWVPNIKKSKFNTVKNQKYDIILKYHEKERKEINEQEKQIN